jgi:hypothetical protein
MIRRMAHCFWNGGRRQPYLTANYPFMFTALTRESLMRTTTRLSFGPS